MIQEYQSLYNKRPTSELDGYCRLEGVSPLFIYMTAEKEKVYPKPKNAVKSLKYLFKKRMGIS